MPTNHKDERLRQTPRLKVRPIPNDASVTSNRQGRLHVRGNGLGNLKMPVSLGFFHFQQLGWK
jgi:hypothetical protein